MLSIENLRPHLTISTRAMFGRGFPGDPVVKNLPANAGDTGSIPGSGRSPREGNGNPLQYSCLENPCTEEPGGATVRGVTKRWYDWAHTHSKVTGKKIISNPYISVYASKPPDLRVKEKKWNCLLQQKSVLFKEIHKEERLWNNKAWNNTTYIKQGAVANKPKIVK